MSNPNPLLISLLKKNFNERRFVYFKVKATTQLAITTFGQALRPLSSLGEDL